MKPKITIITACYQAEKTISRLLESVHSQEQIELEHIIVDGLSTDNTVNIIKASKYKYKLISEKDSGYYDALNKGISISSGEWIGILNADDIYSSSFSLKNLVECGESNKTDTAIADIGFRNTNGKIFRKVSAKNFNLDWFSKGNMPPHPTFIARRDLFKKFGNYKTDFRIAGDFELIARFLWKNSATWSYLSELVIVMDEGGISNSGLKSKILLNEEIFRACKDLGIKTNYLKIYSKYLTKWIQFL